MNDIEPRVVNVKKAHLNKNGFDNLEVWKENPQHLYIGRNMEYYVKGASSSKWQNPFPVKKYGLEKCLELYENHVRTTELYSQLDELEDKVLGCWCFPSPCHGDVLCRLLQEKKDQVIETSSDSGPLSPKR